MKDKAEGIVEGINQTTKNIAINLAKEGTKIEIIAKVTGLPESQIEHILKKSTGVIFLRRYLHGLFAGLKGHIKMPIIKWF